MNRFNRGILAAALACASAIPVIAHAQPVPPDTTLRLIEQIRDHGSGTVVWWTGHNGWLIKSGDVLVGTDLALEYRGRLEPSPVSALEIAEDLDAVFITHTHSDHFDPRTARVLIEHSKCIFVIPASALETARELGIPEDRTHVATPREPFTLPGGIQVEPIRAIHGNANFAVYYEANLQDCGYVITVGGKRFFQPGDSVLNEDQLFLENIDVLFFSPTEHNTYIDNSVILINTLSPDHILPQHHGTMRYDEPNRFWAKGYPSEVKIRLSQPLQERYHILEIGAKLDIE